MPFIIITCPGCGVKNRLRSYDRDRIPVCPKCKTKLVARDENEAHAKFGKMVDKFYDLPDIGLRSDEPK
ncbi:MAG: hypothetical protein HY579_11845 [Nitrospinae bacterium]|nr:hypothetical protein [Nitrospinota bacterium]